MDGIRFEWDPAKAIRNRRKHGVSFEEAQTVVHVFRAAPDTIRIISARKATKLERATYAKGLN